MSEYHTFESSSESSSAFDERIAEELALSTEDHRLFDAVERNNSAKAAAAAVQQTIRDGANVNAVRDGTTPLMIACRRRRGYDQTIRILLDAGADARWSRGRDGSSAILQACWSGHLSTVQLLINHDNGLLESVDDDGWTPLIVAIHQQNSSIVQFLLERGADPHCVDQSGETAFMHACQRNDLEIVRLLLAAGVDVEARDWPQETALHYAARRGHIEVVRELILQHNANMFAANRDGITPFDLACDPWLNSAFHIPLLEIYAAVNPLLEMYGNKLTQDHGRLALHKLLKVAEYSFAEDHKFHPPLYPLRIILPLGKLNLKHYRTLLHAFDPELIRTRDDTGKLPIHIACQTNAPVEVLTFILELDPAVLHIADYAGALPIHLLCGTPVATEYASVRYLVEQGGVGTLAARNKQGASPLHVLCGSTNPPLRTVQYLIQSFPGSVAMQSNAGLYPFMMAAAAESSSESLSVIYELVRVNPGLVVPR